MDVVMNALSSLGEYQILIALVLFLLCIVLLILVIVLSVRQGHLDRKLDVFMRGKDADSLEDVIRDALEDLRSMKSEVKSHRTEITQIRRQYLKTCSKMGVIKYNGFVGMGGKASFALCILDNSNTGIILNVIHSREGSYPYIKEVTNGVCETAMSEEERTALEMAMRSK